MNDSRRLPPVRFNRSASCAILAALTALWTPAGSGRAAAGEAVFVYQGELVGALGEAQMTNALTNLELARLACAHAERVSFVQNATSELLAAAGLVGCTEARGLLLDGATALGYFAQSGDLHVLEDASHLTHAAIDATQQHHLSQVGPSPAAAGRVPLNYTGPLAGFAGEAQLVNPLTNLELASLARDGSSRLMYVNNAAADLLSAQSLLVCGLSRQYVSDAQAALLDYCYTGDMRAIDAAADFIHAALAQSQSETQQAKWAIPDYLPRRTVVPAPAVLPPPPALEFSRKGKNSYGRFVVYER